jgi:sugar O-acyltransferase (sialic acid O-acetyltransferase NeuD family)
MLPVPSSGTETMDRVVVFGNGPFAELLCFHLTHDSAYEVAGFTVDAKYRTSTKVLGRPVVCFEDVETVFPPPNHKMLLPVSFQRLNHLRAEKYLQAKAKGYQLINYVSSKAVTYAGLKMGDNCVVLENAVIAPFATIGNNVIVGSSAIVGHHSTVRDHSFIGPGAVILGGSTIDEYCLIGANATIKEAVTVSRECLIGSSVWISRNTRPKGVYFNPSPDPHPMSSDELHDLLMWPMRRAASSED